MKMPQRWSEKPHKVSEIKLFEYKNYGEKKPTMIFYAKVIIYRLSIIKSSPFLSELSTATVLNPQSRYIVFCHLL